MSVIRMFFIKNYFYVPKHYYSIYGESRKKVIFIVVRPLRPYPRIPPPHPFELSGYQIALLSSLVVICYIYKYAND